MMPVMKTWVVVSCLACLPTFAAADSASEDAVALRSRVGWGATLEPDRVAVSTEGGWNGGEARATANANVEAAVYHHASVFATASYEANARPAIGAAYQLFDPRTAAVGARISLAYKPEGFAEPEGELESVLVLSRSLGRHALRAMVAYGQDPDGKESDAEVGASFVHRTTDSFVLGGTARYRRGLALKMGEPRWDVIGGALAGYVPGRWRVEVFVGANAVDYARVQSGAVGLISIGADL
jgi:hypothetical protein